MHNTIALDERHIRTYLEARFAGSARILGLSVLGEPSGTADLKGYGYGVPVKVDYEIAGQRRSVVLETVAPGPFGHEHMADRAQILLWSHAAFNELPRHARSLDVGGVRKDGALLSLGDVKEFFILNEYVPGEGYYQDLERLRDGAELREVDTDRADALCDYLVSIHRVRGTNPELYLRRTRELVGHNECIMGILDSYPSKVDSIDAEALEAIEHACVCWRWRLKRHTHRLRQIHGDFHPWNILFHEAADFSVLDRSRGEWGDPADDVVCLTMNYLFFSLQRAERLDGGLEVLFSRFWQRYLTASGDEDLPAVVGPYFAFRGLVMASPVWYPRLAANVRARLFNFIRAVLDAPRFDPSRVNEYCSRP